MVELRLYPMHMGSGDKMSIFNKLEIASDTDAVQALRHNVLQTTHV